MVSGNNTDALLGVCESMYRTGLKPEELFETISQCLLSAVNRDCLSGWGGRGAHHHEDRDHHTHAARPHGLMPDL